MTTRQQKLIRIAAFVLCLGSVFALGWTCGTAAEKAMAAAKHAGNTLYVLWNVDPVESNTAYLQLDMDLDRQVVEADMWRPFLIMPGERRDFDSILSRVAEYRREHPRFRPTPAELAKALDERHSRKSDGYVDAMPKGIPIVGALDVLMKQQAAEADAILARYPAPAK